MPPGQSVALYSEPGSDATDLLDVIAGLRQPRSGEVTVDEFAVVRLNGPELDRYFACRGLLSARFPLRPSLSALDNLLAVPSAGELDNQAREWAEQLLAITGAHHLTGPVGVMPPEQQWRILIARALRLRPRLVLAEDPAKVLDARGATTMLDLLTDVHAQFGFTLLLAVGRLATASRCQRLVRMVAGVVLEDELIGDDPRIRGRVDRIG